MWIKIKWYWGRKTADKVTSFTLVWIKICVLMKKQRS